MASVSRKVRTSRSSIMFTNAVYFPNYTVYQGATPAQLNYSCISLVYYAFAKVTSEGHVFLSDEWVDVNIPCDGVSGALGSLMHLKEEHPYLQVVLSIGGSESAAVYPEVAADPVRRDNFAQSVQALVEASGLDGVDINWVYPSTVQQGLDFLALLAHVRMHLAEDRYYVTTSLPAAVGTLQLLDVAQIGAYVDLINLSAYDLYGPWSSKCGHHAQLYAVGKDEPSGAASVQYLMAHGIAPKKILLGIPLYGRSFLGAAGLGHAFAGAGGPDGTFEYRHLPRPGTHEQVDKRVAAAQCVGGDGGFVSYDNPDTVRMKALFCRQKGLGGLCYWAAPSDSKETRRSLIAAGFRTLHGS